VGMMTSWAA